MQHAQANVHVMTDEAVFTNMNDMKQYETFFNHSRAGTVNWNRPTTGISGIAPFGGLGHSGNFRPTGTYAADYCAYPVISLESTTLQPSTTLPPGINS